MKCTVYLDGEFLVRDDIFLESMTPGIFEGRGVFETMRVEDGQVWFLDRHLARLRQGLRVLNVRLTHSAKEIEAIIHKVMVFNQIKNARLRLMVYQRGKTSSLAVLALPRKVLSHQDYSVGYRITSMPCPGRPAKFACVKSLDYAHHRDAYHKAAERGFHETLLVNPKGYVFEASRSNVFYIKKGILYTPSLTLGGLDGVTRRLVLECAREQKVPVKNVRPKVQDILNSEEVFLTNAILGIMPVTRIDSKTIQLGRIGDLTHQLRCRYLKKAPTSASAQRPLLAAV